MILGTKKAAHPKMNRLVFGTSRRTRTLDLRIRSSTLYPVELGTLGISCAVSNRRLRRDERFNYVARAALPTRVSLDIGIVGLCYTQFTVSFVALYALYSIFAEYTVFSIRRPIAGHACHRRAVSC